MISRVRFLQFKQFESQQTETTMRLTSPDSANSDTFVTIKLDGNSDTLSGLVKKRGRMFKVTIEEID